MRKKISSVKQVSQRLPTHKPCAVGEAMKMKPLSKTYMSNQKRKRKRKVIGLT